MTMSNSSISVTLFVTVISYIEFCTFQLHMPWQDAAYHLVEVQILRPPLIN